MSNGLNRAAASAGAAASRQAEVTVAGVAGAAIVVIDWIMTELGGPSVPPAVQAALVTLAIAGVRRWRAKCGDQS